MQNTVCRFRGSIGRARKRNPLARSNVCHPPVKRFAQLDPSIALLLSTISLLLLVCPWPARMNWSRLKVSLRSFMLSLSLTPWLVQSGALLLELVNTSRAQLDRLLDPENQSVTLKTLARAADILGMRVQIELLDS